MDARELERPVGSKTYYECHLTILGEPAEVRPYVEALRWTFSAIHNDIILGEGLKCYATRHFNARLSEAEVQSLLHVAGNQLKLAGLKVIRRKVEKVLYDDRSTKTQGCNGACVECHLDDYKEAQA